MDDDDRLQHEQPAVTEANKVKVRAGETGHHVRTVLIVSIALVIVGFLAVAAFVRP